MRRLSRFAESSGTITVEFALVAGLFFTLVLGIVDFARAMGEWNAAAKATQAGARFASAIDPIADDFKEFSGLSLGLRTGAKIPLDTPGTAAVTCDAGGCGGDPGRMNTAAFAELVARMRRIDGRITAANVVVEYRHIGHGFVGNPLGPDVTPAVTVRLRALDFQFITPGLAGLVVLPMPDFAATLAGEDGTAS